MRPLIDALRNLARRGRTIGLLVLAAVALFLLGYGVNGASLAAIMAAGIAFGCLVALVVVARLGPQIWK